MTQERTASRPSGTVTFRMDSANSGDEALLVDAPTDQVGKKEEEEKKRINPLHGPFIIHEGRKEVGAEGIQLLKVKFVQNGEKVVVTVSHR